MRSKQEYLIAFFIAGLMMLGFGVYIFLINLNPFILLTPIRGELDAAKVSFNSKIVHDRTGKRKEFFMELEFYLKGKHKRFLLKKNVSNNLNDEEYYDLKNILKRSSSITVFIKKGESSEYQPKIFKINCDGEVLLSRKEVTKKERFLSAFLLILGSIITLLALREFFPKWFKKYFDW